MTWQRINENTYIDDTLVTCAEYQLFIDQMREQGKYYQPDHWTSYQFPAGQAREPILGVRQSDALVFCEWVTQREDGMGNYRLPTQVESGAFPMKSVERSPRGYWLNQEVQFEWISLGKRGRGINNRTLTELGFKLNHTIKLAIALHRNALRPLEINVELALNHGFEVNRVLDFSTDRITNLNAVLTHNLYIDDTLGDDRAHILDLCFDIVTLQERIAGRSPAFEGIRLVKERIR